MYFKTFWKKIVWSLDDIQSVIFQIEHLTKKHPITPYGSHGILRE